jgi:phosphate/sulfate permease
MAKNKGIFFIVFALLIGIFMSLFLLMKSLGGTARLLESAAILVLLLFALMVLMGFSKSSRYVSGICAMFFSLALINELYLWKLGFVQEIILPLAFSLVGLMVSLSIKNCSHKTEDEQKVEVYHENEAKKQDKKKAKKPRKKKAKR